MKRKNEATKTIETYNTKCIRLLDGDDYKVMDFIKKNNIPAEVYDNSLELVFTEMAENNIKGFHEYLDIKITHEELKKCVSKHKNSLARVLLENMDDIFDPVYFSSIHTNKYMDKL